MASVTHRVVTPSTANATSYVSGSFTPAVGDLLWVTVAAAGTTTAFPTLTSSAGTTFRFIGVALVTASVDRLYTFLARTLVTSATPQTVTFDCTGDAATGATIAVASVSSMTRTADTGAVRQYKVASNVAAGTPAVTFDNSVLTGNPTLVCVGNATNPAGLTEPTGWTEGADSGNITPTHGLEYAYRNSGFTGTTVTWGSASASAFGAIVMELDTTAPPTNSITVVGTPTLNASATARTSTVLTSPSGSQADDIAIIQIQHSTGSANGTQSDPDGTWTLIDTQRGSGVTAWCFLYAKRLTGAAAATYTFTHPSTVSTGAMFILRGVDTTTMLDKIVAAGDLVSDTLTPYPVPVIATATNKALAVAIFSGAATASGFITGWPLDYEEVVLYTDALTTCKMAIYVKEIAVAGNTPTVQYATISDKDMLVGHFAFRPAATFTTVDLTYTAAVSIQKQIDLAYNAATTIQKQLDLTYQTATTVQKQNTDLTYQAATVVQKQVDLTYQSAVSIQREISLQYSSATTIQKEIDLTYQGGVVAQRVDIDLTYQSAVSILKAISLAYDAAVSIEKTIDLTYAVGVVVQKQDTDLTYDAALFISREVDLTYTSAVTVQKTVDLTYQAGVTIQQTIDLPYMAALVVQKEIDLPYSAGTGIQKEIDLTYSAAVRIIQAGIVDLPYEAAVSIQKHNIDLTYQAAVIAVLVSDITFEAALTVQKEISLEYAAAVAVLRPVDLQYAAALTIQVQDTDFVYDAALAISKTESLIYQSSLSILKTRDLSYLAAVRIAPSSFTNFDEVNTYFIEMDVTDPFGDFTEVNTYFIEEDV